MKKNEKIAVITHGVPNFISEGASKEPIILIKSFLKKKINVKLFILYEEDDFSSPLKQKNSLGKISTAFFIAPPVPSNSFSTIILTLKS